MSAVLALPGVAHAVVWADISGATYSYSTVWYTSTNYRTKSENGNVHIRFDKLPRFASGTYDAIKWRYIANNGSVIGGSHYTIWNVDTWDTHWYMGQGQQFRNSFARQTTCTVNCDHSFSGDQVY